MKVVEGGGFLMGHPDPVYIQNHYIRCSFSLSCDDIRDFHRELNYN